MTVKEKSVTRARPHPGPLLQERENVRLHFKYLRQRWPEARSQC